MKYAPIGMRPTLTDRFIATMLTEPTLTERVKSPVNCLSTWVENNDFLSVIFFVPVVFPVGYGLLALSLVALVPLTIAEYFARWLERRRLGIHLFGSADK